MAKSDDRQSNGSIWIAGNNTYATGSPAAIAIGGSGSYTMSITPQPDPPKSEIERLLAEVEAVCVLAR